MSQGEEILRNLYREIAEHEAPALFAKTRELAEQAKVLMPKIHFQRSDVTAHKMFDYLIGIMPKGKDMVVGKEILNMFGANNPSASISEEFAAVIAHEMGHIKHRDLAFMGGKQMALASPLVGVALGIGAVAMFENYQKRKVAKQQATPQEKLPGEDGAAVDEKQLKQVNKDKDPYGWLITTAKYLAAGAAGLLAGVFMFKAIHHQMEFRADAYSAKLMGSGKPLANALDRFNNIFKAEAEAAANTMRSSGVSEEQIKKMEKINKFVSTLTHPPMDKRIERLGGI